jgi:uncharacterized protein (TIRG00374 family)
VTIAVLSLHFLVQSALVVRLLSLRGVAVRVREVYAVTLAASFFGAFVPGSGGPDLVLCVNLRRSGVPTELALAAVLVMRVLVLFAMVLFACVMSLTSFAPHPAVRGLTAGLVAAFVLLGALVSSDGTRRLVERWAGALQRFRLAGLAHRTYDVVADVGRDARAHLALTPFYLGLALLKIGIDYLIARSLGLDLSFLYFLIVAPLVFVFAMLPVSMAGIGVRESSYAGLFALLGLSAADGVAISLASFSLSFWTMAAGALVYGFRGATLKVVDR